MGRSTFKIDVTTLARHELDSLRVFERRKIEESIDSQLRVTPDVPTRNRKPLPNVTAGFEFVPPLWELRIGNYRVFYDVDRLDMIVQVRAVREKPAHLTTQEILQ